MTDRGVRHAVEVSVDGTPLPLKEFLHDILGGTVVGLVSALRGGSPAREIVVTVRLLDASTPGSTDSGDATGAP